MNLRDGWKETLESEQKNLLYMQCFNKGNWRSMASNMRVKRILPAGNRIRPERAESVITSSYDQSQENRLELQKLIKNDFSWDLKLLYWILG